MKVQELLVFELSGLAFAVPLSSVEEVVPASVITRVPHSPPFLLGLAAARGKVVGVIDAARRYSLPPSLGSFFLVCRVRGNLTAVTIDRPVLAGELSVRPLAAAEAEQLREKYKVDSKFISGGLEVLEFVGVDSDDGPFRPLLSCLVADPDLFVSAEMAAQVGEAG